MVDKISKFTLWGLMGLSILVFALFVFVGFNNKDLQGLEFQNNVTSVPKFTDVLLCWTYALIAIAIVATIVAVISGFFIGGGKSEKGAAKFSGIIAWGICAAAVVIGIFVGVSGKNETMLINGELFNEGGKNASDIILTDTSMIAILALTCVTVLATVFSMLKKNN